MKQISNKEYEKYQQYQTDKLRGRIPSGVLHADLCLAIQALDDPDQGTDVGLSMPEVAGVKENLVSRSADRDCALAF